MSQTKKIGAALTSAIVTTLFLAWMFVGPGWETFFPIIYDLFVQLGASIQLTPPS